MSKNDVDVQIVIDEPILFSTQRLETLLKEISILKTAELKFEVAIGKRLKDEMDPTIKARRIKVTSKDGVFCYQIGDYAVHKGQFVHLREDGYRFNNGKLEEDVYFGGMFIPKEFNKVKPSD